MPMVTSMVLTTLLPRFKHFKQQVSKGDASVPHGKNRRISGVYDPTQPNPQKNQVWPSITICKGGIVDTSNRPHNRSCTSRGDHDFAERTVLEQSYSLERQKQQHEAPCFFCSGPEKKTCSCLGFVHHIPMTSSLSQNVN